MHKADIMYKLWYNTSVLLLPWIPHKQDKQWTDNVTRVAFVQQLLQWKRNKYYMFRERVFVALRYPVWNAHAPYCHLWPVRLCNIFPHYLIKGKIFGGRGGGVIEYKMRVLIFSANLSETSLILRRTERDMFKNVCWSPCNVFVILVRL